MGNIQKTFNSLKPYVIGMRYLEQMPIVDVVFKEEWVIPDDKEINKIQSDDVPNYYMLYTDNEAGVDLLLLYVEKVIKLNQEREKKHQLLSKKVAELKSLFQTHTLNKLLNLKFTFGEQDLTPTLDELKLDTELVEIPVEEEINEPIQTNITEPVLYLDENKQPIQLTEEEKEMMEEEARAEVNRKLYSKKQTNNSLAKKIELPPKKELNSSGCFCGPEQACEKCIDTK